MKKLRIALLKQSMNARGGLEKYAHLLFQYLKEQGHNVSFLSTAKTTETIAICRPLKPSFLNLLWFDYHARKWLKNHPQDVIVGLDRHVLPLTHYRAGNGCHAAYLARRKKDVSLIRYLSFHLNPLHILTKLSEHKTFEAPSKTIIICNSHLVKQEILHFYPKTNPNRLLVIHNGVEWEQLQADFQQKLLAPKSLSSPPHLLFIGHEWQRKGLDKLLTALALLKDHQFILTVIGRERHPQYFINIAKQYGIHHKVRFHPTEQNPIPFYKSANIAVLPSRYDPFANVTVEALAMGLYVITTNANGGSEAIISHTNGCVIDEEAQPQLLAKTILSAFDVMKDPTRPELIRESVRHYDLSLKLQQLISVLEKS